jgi:hypothetical protein
MTPSVFFGTEMTPSYGLGYPYNFKQFLLFFCESHCGTALFQQGSIPERG